MDSDDGESEEAEEDRLLAELRTAVSLSSPYRPNALPPLPKSAFLSPPRRGLDLDEGSEEGEEDEDELLARALLEDSQINRTPVIKPTMSLESRFAMLGKGSDRREQTASAAASNHHHQQGSDSHDEETERLLEILKKASGEAPIPDEHFNLDDAMNGGGNNRETTETIRRLRALVAHLEARVAHEKRRAEDALDHAANLYAQRFALAILCAASIPPLAVALIAHRYDLHELEARSDALGVLAVAVAVLIICAVTLWRKARSQLSRTAGGGDSASRNKSGISSKEPKSKATSGFESSKKSSSASQQQSISIQGIRKRTKRSALTKTEAVF